VNELESAKGNKKMAKKKPTVWEIVFFSPTSELENDFLDYVIST
jgi:hypothetical protein